MRPGQNRRMRGRNRKGPNPLTRSYEFNGPDVKVRGTAQHIAEKYTQLARDAQASGDPVAAENYFQHAEHYFRIIAAAQAQLQQNYGGFQRSFDDERDDLDLDETNGNGFGYGQQPAVHELGAPQPDVAARPSPTRRARAGASGRSASSSAASAATARCVRSAASVMSATSARSARSAVSGASAARVRPM